MTRRISEVQHVIPAEAGIQDALPALIEKLLYWLVARTGILLTAAFLLRVTQMECCAVRGETGRAIGCLPNAPLPGTG